MAILTNTGLETHPSGTANPGGIVNANWSIIEKIFSPALSGADALFHLVWKCALRYTGSNPTTAARIVWDTLTGRWIIRAGQLALASGTGMLADFNSTEVYRTAALAHNPTFTFASLEVGRRLELYLTASGSSRVTTWPAGMVWLDAGPVTIPDTKTAKISLYSSGTTDAAVFGTFTLQP